MAGPGRRAPRGLRDPGAAHPGGLRGAPLRRRGSPRRLAPARHLAARPCRRRRPRHHRRPEPRGGGHMTTVRRVLGVLGLALAVVMGSSLPASATFSDTTVLSMTSVGAASVVAPGAVTGTLTCGPRNTTMGVTWNPSGSRGVSGYRITVLFSDGYEQSEDVAGASTSSWSTSITTYNVTAYAVRFS